MVGLKERVESSMMNAVMYLPDKEELFIQFVGGTIYRYLEIPKELYRELMESESKGEYFNRNIKKTYPTHRVDEFPSGGELKPYNTIVVDGKTYDDYSIRLRGVVYDISVCRETREMDIREDEDQGR